MQNDKKANKKAKPQNKINNPHLAWGPKGPQALHRSWNKGAIMPRSSSLKKKKKKSIAPEISPLKFPAIPKSGQPPNVLSSLRPINNLVALKKLLKEHLQHLTKFLNQNDIIHNNHHGGRKHHSTTTALLQIHDEIYKSQENFNITALFTTDLTAAYDTVDSVILSKSWSTMGYRGKS